MLRFMGSRRVGHDWSTEQNLTSHLPGFPGVSDGKESTCNADDPGSTPGSGRCPGDGNGNPNPVFLPGKLDRGDMVGYSPWGRKESDTTE